MHESDGDETLSSEAAADPPVPPPPAEVARFQPLRKLGQGGMGEVWQVRDQRLDRTVALKRSRRGQGGARFLQEAEIAAQLQHPGILPVYDVGTDPDGALYFTMRELSGSALRGLLPGLGPTRLVGVLLRVCEAVAYAHGQGILHRDLKPDNVMVGDYGEVVVIDWGVAARLDALREAAAEARAEPGSGTGPEPGLVGTVGYMPPEQARGDLARMGPTADVFAIGAVLYEGLVGRRPFASVEATFAGEVEVPPAVAHELAAVLRRALAPDPGERYPSAEALRDDLQAWLEARPLQGLSYHPLNRLSLWARRHRGVLRAAGLVAAVALVFLVLGALKYLHDVEAEVARAQASELRAEQALARSELAEGLAKLSAERLDEARAPLESARERLARTGQSPVPAQLGLWVADAWSPAADARGVPWPSEATAHPLERSSDSEPVLTVRLPDGPLTVGPAYATWLDTRWLVASSYFQTTWLWDLEARTRHRALCPLRCRAWGSPDGRWLAVFDEVNEVLRLEELETGAVSWARPWEDAQALAWTADALVVGGDQPTLSVLDRADGAVSQRLGGHRAPVRDLRVHGGRLYSRDTRDRVLAWELPLEPAHRIALPLEPHGARRTGDELVLAGSESVSVLSLADRSVTQPLALPRADRWTAVTLGEDLWAVQGDGSLVRLRRSDGAVVDTLPHLSAGGLTARTVLTATDEALVIETRDETVALWSPTEGLRWSAPADGRLWGARVAGDRVVLSCWGARELRVLDLRTGALLERHELAASPYEGDVTADGRLAFGLADGTVALVVDGTLRVLHGHQGLVLDAAFSGDGALLASLDWGSHLRIWDARTGAPLAEQRLSDDIFAIETDGARGWVLPSVRDGVWELKLGEGRDSATGDGLP